MNKNINFTVNNHYDCWICWSCLCSLTLWQTSNLFNVHSNHHPIDPGLIMDGWIENWQARVAVSYVMCRKSACNKKQLLSRIPRSWVTPSMIHMLTDFPNTMKSMMYFLKAFKFYFRAMSYESYLTNFSHIKCRWFHVLFIPKHFNYCINFLYYALNNLPN